MIKQRYFIILILLFNTYFINAFFDTFELIKNQNAVVIGEGLRLRKEPNANSQILYRFSFGDEVKILEIRYDNGDYIDTVNDIKNYWWKVETKDNIVGWVFAEYLAYPFYKDGDELITVSWYLEKFDSYYKPLLRIYKEKNLITKYPLYKYINKFNKDDLDNLKWSKGFAEKLREGDLRILIPNKIEIDNINNLKVIKINGIFYEGIETAEFILPDISEIWFKLIDNKISAIFSNMKIKGYGTSYDTILGIKFLKNNNLIQEIEQTYKYIPMIIEYDYFNSILLKLNEKEIDILKTHYYTSDCPKIIILKNKNILNAKEMQILNKYYRDEVRYEYHILKKELNKIEIEEIKRIFHKLNYIPPYYYKNDLSNDKLEEIRQILEKVEYKFEDKINNYIWDGEKFILK